MEIPSGDTPLNSDESQIIQDLEVLLAGMDLNPDASSAQDGSVARMLAVAWASFLDDVRVLSSFSPLGPIDDPFPFFFFFPPFSAVSGGEGGQAHH